MIAREVKISGVDEAMKRLDAKNALGGLDQAVGQSVSGAVQDFYFKLDGERANVLGGRRSHFYRQAGISTSWKTVQDGVVVTVDKLGLRQRLEGGTIRAVNVKFLTIPARAEAVGVPIKEFPEKLGFVKTQRGWAAVKRTDYRLKQERQKKDFLGGKKVKALRQDKTDGLVVYWLVPSVYQKPDPTVIPSQEYLVQAAAIGVGQHFQKVMD